MHDLRHAIRDAVDFPEEGVLFKDLTPILKNPALLSEVVERVATQYAELRIDAVASPESLGPMFAAPIALRMKAPFVPIRKGGRSPQPGPRAATMRGDEPISLEIAEGGLGPGARVLIVDDVLATGVTAALAGELVEETGAEVVGYAFVAALGFLDGRDRLTGAPILGLSSF